MNEFIYGIHAVRAFFLKYPKCVLCIYTIIEDYNYNKRTKKLIYELKNYGITINIVKKLWIDNKFKGIVHQGIIAKVKKINYYLQEKDLFKIFENKKNPILLVLDGVTDPHNLGACIRCADAAGVLAVIIPRHNSAKINAATKKVASGAVETVQIFRVTNLARTLYLLKEHVWIVGTTLVAKKNIYKSKLNCPLALVIGSEGNGIRRIIYKYCDELVYIPMAGSVSSLNVSVAAGVCLFEAVRQRLN